MENKHWTSSISKNIKLIGDLSIGYKWMHLHSAKMYLMRHRCLMYTSLVLSPIVTFILIVESTLIRPKYPDNHVLSLIASALTLIVTITLSIVEFGGYKDLSDEHQTFAAKYMSLISNIRRQMDLDVQQREIATDYLAWIVKSYDELFEMSPLIKETFVKKYMELAKEKNLPIPEESLMEISAMQIINVDNTLPIIVTKKDIDIEKCISQYNDCCEIDINDEPQVEIKDSPLNIVYVSQDWKIRDTETPPEEPLTATSTINQKRILKNNSKYKSVIIEANKFDDQRMQFEMNRLRDSRK